MEPQKFSYSLSLTAIQLAKVMLQRAFDLKALESFEHETSTF